MNENNIDLCSFVENGQLMLMAIAIDGKDDWHSDPMPNKGAIGPLAKQVMDRFPSVLASVKDWEMWLTIIHFRNIGAEQNSGGQTYPARIETAP